MTTDELRCLRVIELLADYLEDALDADQADSVRAHLAGCDACTAFLAQLQLTVSLVGRLPSAGELDPSVRQVLVREFRAVLG